MIRRSWARGVLALLTLPLLLAGMITRPAGATFRGELDQIVFAQPVERGEDITDWDIFTMRADGTALLNITDSAFYQGMPSWSPDGRKIAYASDSGLLVRDLASGRIRKLVPARFRDGAWSVAWESSWSPDGTRIVYSWVRYKPDELRPEPLLDGSIEAAGIRSIPLGGGKPRVLVPLKEGVSMEPAWSPDGDWIVFVRFLPGYENAGDADLYRIKPNGKDMKRIHSTRWADKPRWTPDGRILFRSELGCPPEVYFCATLQTMDADGRDLKALTQWPEDWSKDAQPDFVEDATMSPDGRKVLVQLEPYHHTFYGDNPEQLWMWDLESGSKQLLAENSALGSPDFRPGCTIVGTHRDEVLRGTPGNDLICALGGDDSVYGRGGDDVIFGHGGNDRIVGGAGRDIVVGNGGRDRCDLDPRDHSRVC